MFGLDETIAFRDREKPHRQVSTLFLVVCLQYFLGTVFFIDFPVIEIIWVVLLCFILLFVRPTTITVVSALYLILAISYTTGLAFNNQGLATSYYYRSIVTSYILSTLLVAFLNFDLRRLNNNWRPFRYLYLIHFSTITFFSIWALLALHDLNVGLLVDFRDVTGFGYITLSDTFALLSIAYLCRAKLASWEFVLVWALSVTVIFLLGSRTALVFYPFATALLLRRHVSFFGVVKWSSLLSIPVYFLLQNRIDLESGAFFRFRTLLNFSADRSSTVRGQLRDKMIETISENPECLILACHPAQGTYEHSIFSVIQYFGIIGILLIIMSVIVAFKKIRFLSQQWYFPIFIYCAMSSLLSRPWVSVVFPIFIAFLIDAVLSSSRKQYKPRIG